MDLSTNYLGLQLKNPIVPSAGPVSQEVASVKRLEDAGAAAVVLYSLFEEQIEAEALELLHYTTHYNESYAEATNYFPQDIEYKAGPEEYLNLIRKCKEQCEIPIIASLNGSSTGGWIKYAKKIEEAGADALELNIYLLPTDFNRSGQQIEQVYIDVVKEVKRAVNMKVAVKLSPFFSSFAWMADQLDRAGADGLVLFNRFYQPDIDLDTLDVVPNVLLSTPMAMRLPLRWVGILYGRLNCDLAATSGIYSEKDVIKMIMAGAKITQMLSSIIKFGPNHISDVLTKMRFWMEANEYASVEMMRGSMSYINVADPSKFERANYMKVISSVKL
ncbi:MAG: dihydroorotate dehydrogenase-like protein [Ignavibacteriaceae bacterium]|nr:dihydroorotate dehydrogenase-like protein [Ignavibacteriaceae bacterium]